MTSMDSKSIISVGIVKSSIEETNEQNDQWKLEGWWWTAASDRIVVLIEQ